MTLLFLTGTRADFGKLKSLIALSRATDNIDVHLFATGMHLQEKYGYTVLEIEKSGFDNIIKFDNHTASHTMDLTLAKTIQGFSAAVQQVQPDLIIVHGDRVEALAGATVGALSNIRVAHIEGGEISGTIDELIRHAVSKLSHLHLVSNEEAERRLVQMGELPESVHVIGSPDVDTMFAADLPSTAAALEYYDIPFDKYAIGMFHPVTTEVDNMEAHAQQFVDALLAVDQNFILIYPNNDLGCEHIFKAYERLKGHQRFKIFPSLRFEYFLALLKNAQLMVGNSSAGVREAPYYGIPTIDIGSRQTNRASGPSIINTSYDKDAIIAAFAKAQTLLCTPVNPFGNGDSAQRFVQLIQSGAIQALDQQKQFRDL